VHCSQGVVPLGEPEVDDFPVPEVELREPRLLRAEPSRFGGIDTLPPGEPVLPPKYNGESTGPTAESVLLQDAQDMVITPENGHLDHVTSLDSNMY
jgi:hypothetical protein